MKALAKKALYLTPLLLLVACFERFSPSPQNKAAVPQQSQADAGLAIAQLKEADLLANERNTVQVFRRSTPFVVFVHRMNKQVDFFSFHSQSVKTGSGSGFVWDRQGHVVTNYHVVAGADGVTLSLGKKGESYPAKLVGAEPRKDIAVLKLVDPKVVPSFTGPNALPLADSSHLTVGQKTLAIGNPFGLDRSLSVGVISALGRQLPGVGGVTIRNMIQTDASINPGNSGGPLLNSQGQLIGMNTVIYSKSGASAGVGFAVPANTIKRIVNQIIRHGRVILPGIGATLMDGTYARHLGIKGVIIAEIKAGTPAAKAGLRGTRRGRNGWILGDVIVAVNGKAVHSYDDLYTQLENKSPGQEVEVTVLRDDRKISKKMPLVDINML